MYRIAKFEKVSFETFKAAWNDLFADTEEEIQAIYESIKLPVRATKGSAGYDFFTPINILLNPKETLLMPTGIRVKIDEGWFLGVVPKSGLGFKYRLQMDNTMGIIDSDYYYSDNEGHIFIKMTNDNNQDKSLNLTAGDSVCQGIFLPYGITKDDSVSLIRNGGLGSTSK